MANKKRLTIVLSFSKATIHCIVGALTNGFFLKAYMNFSHCQCHHGRAGITLISVSFTPETCKECVLLLTSGKVWE